jgi:hypothetical protein
VLSAHIIKHQIFSLLTYLYRTSSASAIDLSLPLKREYTTYKLFKKAAQAHARIAGYAFNIRPRKRKDPNIKQQQKTLIYHKKGKYKTSLTNKVHRIKKKQKTEKCQCPFAVKTKKRLTGL